MSALRFALVLGIIGGFLQAGGGAWDISWHIDQGRETFWSPPHLVLYAGVLSVLVAVLTLVFSNGGVAVLRRERPLAAVVACTLAQLASAPFDELWHRLYGIDITVWSPPHLLLIMGGSASMLALALTAYKYDASAFGRASAIVLTGASTLFMTAIVAEWEFPNIPRTHESQLRPVWTYPVTLMGLMSLMLVLSHRLYGRFGATKVYLVALVARLTIMGLLLGQRSPLLAPPLLLPAALGVDGYLMTFAIGKRRRSLWMVIAAGMLAAAHYLFVEQTYRLVFPGWPRLSAGIIAGWYWVMLASILGAIAGRYLADAFEWLAGIHHDEPVTAAEEPVAALELIPEPAHS